MNPLKGLVVHVSSLNPKPKTLNPVGSHIVYTSGFDLQNGWVAMYP